jgi:hypothetical protein
VLHSKDIEKYDETSSLHVMIELMILLIWEEDKKYQQEASYLLVL